MGELVTGILKVKIRIVLWALKAALYFNLEYWLWGQFSFSCSLYLCSTQGTASFIQFSSVQSLSRVRLCATLGTAACQASLSITNSKSLLKLMSIEWVMPSNHLILCRPLLLLPSVFPSIRVLSNELALCIRWPKYWVSASGSVLPMNIQVWQNVVHWRREWQTTSVFLPWEPHE